MTDRKKGKDLDQVAEDPSWDRALHFRNLPTEKILELLEEYKTFIFEVWKNHPKLHQKTSHYKKMNLP